MTPLRPRLMQPRRPRKPPGRAPFATAALAAHAALAIWAIGGCGDNLLTPTFDGAGELDGGSPPDAGPEPEYSIVVLPDTQFYASSWPAVFAAQTRWVLENRERLRIAFVLHTGDLVDSDTPDQWSVAAMNLRTLDGQLPYVVTAGNHDYTNLADRMGMGNAYFPPSVFEPSPWFRGTFEPEHIENNYSVFTIGDARWLVLALEFGPRDEVLDWANAILDEFPATPAIVVTHAYLASDGRRYDRANRQGQRFNPHDYVMMDQPGTTINDGEEIWRKLVARHGNIKLVFSGHDVSGGDLPPGTVAVLTSERTDGSRVHQVLANYQTCLGPPCTESAQGTLVHGGNGFLRILRVSEADHAISVQTYSPYTDTFLSDAGNQFVLPMN